MRRFFEHPKHNIFLPLIFYIINNFTLTFLSNLGIHAVFISQLIRFASVCSNVRDFNNNMRGSRGWTGGPDTPHGNWKITSHRFPYELTI